MMEIFNQNTEFRFKHDVSQIIGNNDLVFLFASAKKDMLNSDYSNFGHIVVIVDSDHADPKYRIPSFNEIQQKYKVSLDIDSLVYFGDLSGKKCFCLKKSLTIDSANLQSILLKTSYKFLQVDEFQAATLGHHIFHWLNTHRYCGVCRGSNKICVKEMAVKCESCGFRVYPTISPCVIAVIYRGDEILLAQAAHSVTGAYGCISGYVSPGENLETALKREVFEEVGLKIHNIKYITSQQWPFPNSILMGFTAEYLSEEINIDRKEIADAKWFHTKSLVELPILPDPISIARHLIDLFIK